MVKSPGNQKWPEHKVIEEPAGRGMVAEVAGELIAESTDAIKLMEDEHADRFYFPRADVKMGKLTPSPTTTECPFKGHASYYNLELGGHTLEDAAWSYEDPYEEHQALKGRIAFYDDKHPQIKVHGGA